MGHVLQHIVGRAALLSALGLGLTAGGASALRLPLLQDSGYPMRVALVFGAVLAVALPSLPRHHPFPRLGAANIVTGARAGVMALLAGVATAPGAPVSTWLLVMVASAGAAADLLDGWLARRSGLASRFGARFDMEIDALLVLVLSALVWRAVPLGAWILASGLMRYAFLAAGWLLPWMAADLPPSRRRQAICVAQIVGLIVALSPLLSPSAARGVSLVGLALLGWSFAVDVRWLQTRRYTP